MRVQMTLYELEDQGPIEYALGSGKSCTGNGQLVCEKQDLDLDIQRKERFRFFHCDKPQIYGIQFRTNIPAGSHWNKK